MMVNQRAAALNHCGAMINTLVRRLPILDAARETLYVQQVPRAISIGIGVYKVDSAGQVVLRPELCTATIQSLLISLPYT